MQWVDRMNRAMDYLEAHLADTIDPDEIARIMASPYSVFQRSFAPVTGISLSEYLRRRRLTSAAHDLQSTDMRVLDVAVKYGYNSADAFTAAFKRMHGVTPQEVRRADAQLKFYPKLRFSLQITEVAEMDYRVMELDAMGVLGMRRVTGQGGGTWALVKTGDYVQRLAEICGAPCCLGLCFGSDAQGNNDYMCAARFEGEPPQGYDFYRVPAGKWLVFLAEGAISQQVLWQTWRRIYGEFMPQSAYLQLDLPTIENYLLWDEAGDRCRVEIMIPVS